MSADAPDTTMWELLFGEHQGMSIRMGLTFLAQAGLTTADIDKALNTIDHETTIGPLLDPTAYVDGRRFLNAAEYADMLRALRHVVRVLAHADIRKKGLVP